MSKSNEQAFPCAGSEFSNLADHQRNEPQHGLTKREYFAAKAMQSRIIAADMSAPYDVARDAVAYADELLKALEE